MSLKFTALEIGKGDAFLIQDEGKNYLFDSGGSMSLIQTLLSKKDISTIDVAICSHNDDDHAKGFLGLLSDESKISIKEIWLPSDWASLMEFEKEGKINVSIVKESVEGYEGSMDGCNNGDRDNIIRRDGLFDNESSVSVDSFNESLKGYSNENDSDCRGKRLCPMRICRRYCDDNDFCYPIRKYCYHCCSKKYHCDRDRIRDCEFPNDECCCHDDYLCRRCLENYLHYCRYYCHRYEEGRCEVLGELIEYLKAYKELEVRKEHKKSLRVYEGDFVEILDSIDFKANTDIAKKLGIKLKNIKDIAIHALNKGCKIKWFSPSNSCNIRSVSCGFKALNSAVLAKTIPAVKNTMAFMQLMYLTIENEYSLIFEYFKDDIPVIRFSADSKLFCQSDDYKNNIIVTAPHHGSDANADVYNKIKGNEIIWVRSDMLTSKRPCQEFKNQQIKYCLACKSKGSKTEICFEYDNIRKKWNHVEGIPCDC